MLSRIYVLVPDYCCLSCAVDPQDRHKETTSLLSRIPSGLSISCLDVSQSPSSQIYVRNLDLLGSSRVSASYCYIVQHQVQSFSSLVKNRTEIGKSEIVHHLRFVSLVITTDMHVELSTKT